MCKCASADQCAAVDDVALHNLYSSVEDSHHLMGKMYTRTKDYPGSVELLMPYTNPRGVIWDEDLAQFMDEWTDYSVDDPRWTQSGLTCAGCQGVPSGFSWGRFLRQESEELSRNATKGVYRGWQYATDPVGSYADMALYYTEKMLGYADGIYYDDVFFHASYTLQPAGPGYVGEDGLLHAGVNLWAWRDFLRRTAVMQHVTGKRNVTAIYNHMTNVNVVPLLSWGSVSLDWEWRDDATQAEEDVQTRNLIGCDDRGLRCNDTSYILAQSTGLQSGTIPVAISSGLRGPKCSRT